MLVSKHAAELCAYLANDVLGELPAKVLAALFSKGRSTTAQLVHYTALPPRHLRHGLAVLVQQNMIYFQTDPHTSITSYEANPKVCYTLIRMGKFSEMVAHKYGKAEQEVFQTLAQFGHARMSELLRAFGYEPNRAGASAGRPPGTRASRHISSAHDLDAVISRLVIAGLVDQVGPKTFRNPDDVYREIEEDVLQTGPGEKPNAKTKELKWPHIKMRMQAARDEGTKLKRQLAQTTNPVEKRRKLTNGDHSRGSIDTTDATKIDPNIVLKINFDKCLVNLRNQTLVRCVSESLGEVTGQVYHTVLRLLTARVERCQDDPRLDIQGDTAANTDEDEDDAPGSSATAFSVTSLQIFEALDSQLSLATGFGKVGRGSIDHHSAEQIRLVPRHGDGGLGEDDMSDEEEIQTAQWPHDVTQRLTGGMEDSSQTSLQQSNDDGQVSFHDGANEGEARFNHMRQHLLLLAESQEGFIRLCGTLGRGQWTVDFRHLVKRLRKDETEAVIEQTFGRHGLRLTRILRHKGKLDEKTLPSLALMKKQDVQGKMLALQMAGFVNVQEVPRDNSRNANRTMFFWFFDEDRVRSQLLDNTYKTMLRCLQTLDVQRQRERDILNFVERKDVQGKEQEVMTADNYNKYSQFLELQNKLLGHVMKLDELVSVLKDF